MTWKDEMYASLLKYVQEAGVEAVEVTGIETEYDTPYGGCDTCGHNSSGGEWNVDIVYLDKSGRRRYHTVYTKFEDLINWIT